MRTKLFALVAVVTLFGAALGPGVAAAADEAENATAGNTALAVSVEQTEDVTITVTRNGSGVTNATVDVGGEDNSTYEGIGSYTTDDDGEIELPTPEVNETISVTATADNETATAMADLVSVEYVEENESDDEGASAQDPFGLQVASFVESLLQSDDDGGIGKQVAAFVTQHNPGNAPDHAGPPAHAGPGGEEGEDRRGPPEHAGPGDGDADENESDDDRRGPPEHAGPGGDDEGEDSEDERERDDEDDTEDAEDDAETEDAEDSDEDAEDDTEDAEDSDEDAEDSDEDDERGGGPPDHANAGGN